MQMYLRINVDVLDGVCDLGELSLTAITETLHVMCVGITGRGLADA